MRLEFFQKAPKAGKISPFYFVIHGNKQAAYLNTPLTSCISKTTRWASGSKEAAADEEK